MGWILNETRPWQETYKGKHGLWASVENCPIMEEWDVKIHSDMLKGNLVAYARGFTITIEAKSAAEELLDTMEKIAVVLLNGGGEDANETQDTPGSTPEDEEAPAQ